MTEPRNTKCLPRLLYCRHYIQITAHQTVSVKDRQANKIDLYRKERERDYKNEKGTAGDPLIPPRLTPILLVCFWKLCFMRTRFFFFIVCDSWCGFDYLLYPEGSFPIWEVG